MIYLLSKDFRKSCEMLCDLHLNESIIDTATTLSYYLWTHHRDTVAFDAAHFFSEKSRLDNIKSDIPRAYYPLRGTKDFREWVIQSQSHYAFLIQYLEFLLEEHETRFFTSHKTSYVLSSMPKFSFKNLEDVAQIEKRIDACLDMYNQPRKSWTWTNRDQP